MSNDPKEIAEVLLAQNRKPIDRNIRTLVAELEHENTLLPDTLASTLSRVLKRYRQLKPLLTLVASLGLIPANWRMALGGFTQALDALALAASSSPASPPSPPVPETADFKAGKDL